MGQHVQIARRIAQIVGEIADVYPEHLREDARLADVMGSGTIGLIDLALRVEEAFGIEVGEGEFAHCRTLGDLVRLVERHAPPLREAV